MYLPEGRVREGMPANTTSECGEVPKSKTGHIKSMKASELGGGGSLRQNCQILSVSDPETPPSSVSQYACKAGTFLPCPKFNNLTIDLTSYMTPQEAGH